MKFQQSLLWSLRSPPFYFDLNRRMPASHASRQFIALMIWASQIYQTRLNVKANELLNITDTIGSGFHPFKV